MKKHPILSVLGASASALALSCGAAAYAQSEGTPAASAGGIGDVFVTARKRARSEALQLTPVSANALTSAQLETAVATDLVDVGRLSPGVSFKQGTGKGFNNFAVRGMGQHATAPNDEPPVGVIYDGVYWGTGTGALGELFDLESIEILRGPQGTLFGRNVTGGAIVINTARPNFEKSAQAVLGYGSFDSKEASLVLNAPLLGEAVAGRLSVKYRSDDGYMYNDFKKQDGGGENAGMIRASLLFVPNEDLDILLKAEWFGVDGDSQPQRNISPISPALRNPATVRPFIDGYRTPTDYWSYSAGDIEYSIQDIYQGTAQVNWNVAGGVLSWIGGYRSVRNRQNTDFDGAPLRYFATKSHYNQEQTSNELRFAQDLDRIGYTVGLYYFDSEFSSAQIRTLDQAATGLATDSDQDMNSFAAFGEVDIKLTDRLTATLGARYTEEEKNAVSYQFGDCNATIANASGNYVCTAPFFPGGTYSDDNTSPKVGLSYKISDDHLLFGSVTQAFRSGGFSLRGVRINYAPYDAETVTAYEIASKNDFFDDRLRVNVSVYHNVFEDLQRTVQLDDPFVGRIQSTFNAADATIDGAELEVIANITEHLQFNLNYAYTDAGYDRFDGFTPFPGKTVQDLKFVRIPDNVGNIGFTYTAPAGSLGTITAYLGASYSDAFYFRDANEVTVGQDAYWLADASIALTSPDKDWTLQVWSKNLADEQYALFGSDLGSRGLFINPSAPRSFGARVSKEF